MPASQGFTKTVLINSASGNCAVRINSNGPPQIHKGPDLQGHQRHCDEGPLRDLGKQRRSGVREELRKPGNSPCCCRLRKRVPTIRQGMNRGRKRSRSLIRCCGLEPRMMQILIVSTAPSTLVNTLNHQELDAAFVAWTTQS